MNRTLHALLNTAMLLAWVAVAAAAFESSQAAEVPARGSTIAVQANSPDPVQVTPAPAPAARLPAQRGPAIPGVTPRTAPPSAAPEETPTLCACGAPTALARRLA